MQRGPSTRTGTDPDWVLRVQRAIAEREYEATTIAEGLQAPHRAHNFRTYFAPAGIRVVDRVSESSPLVELRLNRIDRGETATPIPPGAVTVDGARVEIDRGNVTEWYVNSPTASSKGLP